MHPHGLSIMSLTQTVPLTTPETLPSHVAIIMDGNGRWAKARGLPRTAGHKKGADALRNILRGCQEAGIRYLTIYAFSSENWSRPAGEVSDLMALLRLYLTSEIKTLHASGIRLRIIGDRDKLDRETRKQVEQAEKLMEANDTFHLTVALSYGSRQELVNAIRSVAGKVKEGSLDPAMIDESVITKALYTDSLPDPDLLIRTGGEQRLSNFLLWQSAYTELYFSPVLWPDFSIEHLKEALDEYARRERRYGTTRE